MIVSARLCLIAFCFGTFCALVAADTDGVGTLSAENGLGADNDASGGRNGGTPLSDPPLSESELCLLAVAQEAAAAALVGSSVGAILADPNSEIPESPPPVTVPDPPAPTPSPEPVVELAEEEIIRAKEAMERQMAEAALDAAVSAAAATEEASLWHLPSVAVLMPLPGEMFEARDDIEAHFAVSGVGDADLCRVVVRLNHMEVMVVEKQCFGVLGVPAPLQNVTEGKQAFTQVGENTLELLLSLADGPVIATDSVNFTITPKGEPPPPHPPIVSQIFHRVWIGGGRELPDKFEWFLSSWRLRHPGWRIVTWNDANMFELSNNHMLANAETHAEMADVVRLEVILRYGGVYLDTDMQCFKNIEPILENVTIFVAEEDHERICPSIFGAARGHPVLKDMTVAIADWSQQHLHSQPNVKTGPMFWTAYLQSRHFLRDVAGGVVFDRTIFYPYGWWERHRKNEHFPLAYGAHHWAKNWGGGWKD